MTLMKKAKIIVLAGQSNAVGVGWVKYLGDHFSVGKVNEYLAGYESVKINYFSHDKWSGGFVPTTVNCTEKTKDTVGPEVGIAEILSRQETTDGEWFIVKCAIGWSCLRYDWASPSSVADFDYGERCADRETIVHDIEYRRYKRGWYYNEFCDLLHTSISELEGQGYAPEIAAFCWMQGESDQDVDGYTELFNALIGDVRAEFGGYTRDLAVVDCGISASWSQHEEMNRRKEENARRMHYCYIDTQGAGLSVAREPIGAVDFAHYDAGSIIKLGNLMAEKVLESRR